MGITTDRLPFLPDPTLGEEWAIKKARLGGRVNHKEQRVAFTELQGNKLLEANDQVTEGRFAVGEFGLGMGSQALLRGLDVVHQAGQLLQRRRSPGALAQEVIELLESALGYDNTAILLVDRATRQLKPFALSEKAYGGDFSQAYEEYVATHDLRLGVGAAGWVAPSAGAACRSRRRPFQALSRKTSSMPAHHSPGAASGTGSWKPAIRSCHSRWRGWASM